jgi:hypothetical protein
LNADSFTRAEIRRLSNVIRRIIVEDDLRKIAAPRVGKIVLEVPNEEPYLNPKIQDKLYLVFVDNSIMPGMRFERLLLWKKRRAGKLRPPKSDTRLVNTDGFRNQRVLFFAEHWFKRIDIIKYVTILAHGVHSEKHSELPDLLLQLLRKEFSMTLQENLPDVQRDTGAKESAALETDCPDAPATPKKEPRSLRFPDPQGKADIVLVQLLSTAEILVSSPDVMKLEEVIRSEMAQNDL